MRCSHRILRFHCKDFAGYFSDVYNQEGDAMIRLRVLTYVAAAAVFAAIVAGCNSGNSTVNVAPCGTPAGMQAQLIYPAPGSTAIPDNVSQIVVATGTGLPTDWQSGSGWDVLLAYSYNPAYGSGHYAN